MPINVSAQHFSIKKELQDHVVSKLSNYLGTISKNSIKSDVHFNKNDNIFHCNLIVYKSIGNKTKLFKSDHEDFEAKSCFDNALTKIMTQIKKYKSKINSSIHHSRPDKNFDEISAEQ